MTKQDEIIGGIPLKEVLDAIRLEILDAKHVAEDRNIKFGIEQLELELKVEIARKKGGEAGLSFEVFSFGANKENTSTSSHTFKFTLKPKHHNTPSDTEGNPIDINNEQKKKGSLSQG
jgi:hypothetical protein